MIEIYLYGCNCGVNGAFIRTIRRYGRLHFIDVTLYATKFNEASRRDHARLLKENNMPSDSYTPIVVYNGEVKPLRSWTS